jgi:hypothetical protein
MSGTCTRRRPGHHLAENVPGVKCVVKDPAFQQNGSDNTPVSREHPYSGVGERRMCLAANAGDAGSPRRLRFVVELAALTRVPRIG